MNKPKPRISMTAVELHYALQATTYHSAVLSGSHDIFEMTPLGLVMCLVFVLTASQIGGCGFSLPPLSLPSLPLKKESSTMCPRAPRCLPRVSSMSAWIPVIHNLCRQNIHRPSWARFQHCSSSNSAGCGKHADVMGILRARGQRSIF